MLHAKSFFRRYYGSETNVCSAIQTLTSNSLHTLEVLEIWSKELGLKKYVLETGNNQPEAIALYKKNHYTIIPNFGKYEGFENSVCFVKEL